MTKKTQSKYYATLLAMMGLGIIVGFLYGIIKVIIYISNNSYFHYKLYNLILGSIQQNLNKYILIFALLVLVLLVVPAIIIKWIKSSCVEFKIINERNFRTLIYSLFTIMIATIIFYSYFPSIRNVLETNSLFSWLTNGFKIGSYGLFILLFLIYTIVIILFNKLIVSRINILDPAQNIIASIFNSRKVSLFSLGILGLVVLFNIFILGYERRNSTEGPNIVLISIDTLRADHLGSYGYERDTSPNIDNIAEEGVLFENAFSQAPWTLPSMASIHTSLYPSENGVIDHGKKIDDSFLTIAEFLKNNSYKTLGVISMPFVNSKYGFSQGFDTFDEKHISGVNDVSSHLITAEAIDYITQNQKKKFFLWIHYFDPHGAYIPHKEFDYGSNYPGHLPKILDPGPLNFIPNKFDDSDIQYLKDIYDEEISYTDKYIGNLIETVDKLGLKDNTIIIITADHGEEFMERGGFGHRSLLYNELINVPLIIYTPFDNNLRGIRVKDNVEIRNIAKTIVDMIDIPNNPFSGQNLLSKTEASTNDSYIYSNVYKNDEVLKETVISKNHKLIKDYNDQIFELYDLKDDPDEKNNLFGSKQYGIQNLQTTLLTKLSEIKKNRSQKLQEVELKEEDVKKLKALGYLQ